jgi:hypothetical protein
MAVEGSEMSGNEGRLVKRDLLLAAEAPEPADGERREALRLTLSDEQAERKGVGE